MADGTERRRRGRPAARGLLGGALAALLLTPVPAFAAASGQVSERGVGNSSLIMVLDASGSMAEDDGSGSTRMAAAQEALGTAVDALPDGYPTGLRLYGADSSSCTDTRLAHPVGELDREALKAAIGEVGPTGNTPTSLALEKAAGDLPEVPHGSIGRATILLISDGESNCGEVPPCEVARELVGNGVDLRIDTVGFQISEEGRAELECIAEAGHGTYYEAPDGEALGRELERAALLSADGYRFAGEEVSGGASSDAAPVLEPGQYLDTIGPGETRWYAAALDAESAADFAVTAVPHPGVPAAYGDGLRLRLEEAAERGRRCGQEEAKFRSDEGAMILTQAVSRIPSSSGDAACDAAGRYLLSVTRSSAEGSDQAHWPFELHYAVEEPLPAGTVPAASATGYGAAGPDAALPTEDPEDVVGGTGFNDATELTTGVYRDRLLPAQTRYFKVPVGWGQQLRYRVEFGNEPTLEGSPPSSYVRTTSFTPHRKPIPRGDFTVQRGYRGAPLAVDMGTVPVTWTNRWESAAAPQPVRMGGDYYIAVSLGPEAVRIARNAAIGVVLRVEVAGEELSGPEHQAPPLAAGEDGAGGADGAGGEGDDSATGGDKAAGRGAGWSGPVLAAAAGAGSVLLIAAVVVVIGRLRRRPPGGAQGAPGAPVAQGRSEENGTMRGNW